MHALEEDGVIKTITYIIVTWNNETTITECVGSIIVNEPTAQIVVVDNASSDDTVSILNTLFSREVILIPQDRNLGFAEANNRGLAAADTEYVCFLNPDTILIEHVGDAVIDFLENNQNAGVAGPKLINLDGSYQPSVSTFEAPFNTFIRNLGIGKILPGFLQRRYTPFYYEFNTPTKVDWLMGAALYIKTEDARSIGGFSTEYYMYTEDMDFCMKVEEVLKKDVFYLPAVHIIHLGGVSESQNVSYDKYRKMQENELRFVEKFAPCSLDCYVWMKKSAFEVRRMLIQFVQPRDVRAKLLANAEVGLEVLDEWQEKSVRRFSE